MRSILVTVDVVVVITVGALVDKTGVCLFGRDQMLSHHHAERYGKVGGHAVTTGLHGRRVHSAGWCRHGVEAQLDDGVFKGASSTRWRGDHG